MKAPERLGLSKSTQAQRARGLRCWLLAASGEAEDEDWLSVRKTRAGEERLELSPGLFLGRYRWREVRLPPTRLEFEIAQEVLARKVIGGNAKHAALALDDIAECRAWEISWTDRMMKDRHKRRSGRVNAKTIRGSVRALMPNLVERRLRASFEEARRGSLAKRRQHLTVTLGLVGMWRMGELADLFVMSDVLHEWDVGKSVDVVPIWMSDGKTVSGVYSVARIGKRSLAHWCVVRALRGWYEAVKQRWGAEALTCVRMKMGEGGRKQGPLGWAVLRNLSTGEALESKSAMPAKDAMEWLQSYQSLKPKGVDPQPGARDESGHSLRCTGALLALAGGMGEDKVKRRARWSSSAMLKLYTRSEVMEVGKVVSGLGSRSEATKRKAIEDTGLVPRRQNLVEEGDEVGSGESGTEASVSRGRTARKERQVERLMEKRRTRRALRSVAGMFDLENEEDSDEISVDSGSYYYEYYSEGYYPEYDSTASSGRCSGSGRDDDESSSGSLFEPSD